MLPLGPTHGERIPLSYGDFLFQSKTDSFLIFTKSNKVLSECPVLWIIISRKSARRIQVKKNFLHDHYPYRLQRVRNSKNPTSKFSIELPGSTILDHSIEFARLFEELGDSVSTIGEKLIGYFNFEVLLEIPTVWITHLNRKRVRETCSKSRF